MHRQNLLSTYPYKGAIDDEIYKSENARLDDQAQSLADQGTTAQLDEEKLTKALVESGKLLDGLNGYWNQLEPPQRPVLLRAVFPDGRAYESGFVATASSPCLLYERSLPDSVEEALVAPSRFSWIRIQRWVEAMEELRYATGSTV